MWEAIGIGAVVVIVIVALVVKSGKTDDRGIVDVGIKRNRKKGS